VILSAACAIRFDPRKLLDDKGNAKGLHELDAETALALTPIEVEGLKVRVDRGKARSLAEISPRMSRVGAIYKPKSAPGGGVYYWRLVDEAAAAMNLKVSAATVHDTTSIEETIDALARESNAGLLVMPDVFNVLHRKVIIAAAARHRLPAIYPIPTFTVDGGLASYGVDIPDLYRRAAGYVDRVLRGAEPSDLRSNRRPSSI
jgi:ABC-type uncharacterized transport system substrate-binding protein